MDDNRVEIDYMLGMKDCENGVEHKEGKSDSYNEGYSSQYEYEQVESARCSGV
jgi:hypothetical protein